MLNEFINKIVVDFSKGESLSIDITDSHGDIIASDQKNLIGKRNSYTHLCIEKAQEIAYRLTELCDSVQASLYVTPVFARNILMYTVVVKGSEEKARYSARSISRSLESLLAVLSEDIPPVGMKNNEEQLLHQLLSQDYSYERVNHLLESFEHDSDATHCAILLNLETRENKYFNIHLNLGYHVSREQLKEEIIERIKKSEKLNSQDIVAFYNDDDIVIIKKILGSFQTKKIYQAMDAVCSSIIENLEQYRLFGFRIAFGAPVSTLHDIRKSYLTAKQLIEIGNLIDPDQYFLRPEDFPIERLYLNTKDEVFEETIRHIIQSLTGKDDKVDTDTLFLIEALIDSSMNFSKTSRIMNLHRNTINARLEKVKEITGLDPVASFSDQLLMKFAAISIRMDNKDTEIN